MINNMASEKEEVASSYSFGNLSVMTKFVCRSLMSSRCDKVFDNFLCSIMIQSTLKIYQLYHTLNTFQKVSLPISS